METDNSELDLSVMADFDSFVTEFTMSASADVPSLDSTVEELLDISYDDLLSMNSKECSARSFKLSGYAMHIQGLFNQTRARLNWCEDSLNYILSKEWSNYDPYMKYEMKRQAVIMNNEFAQKVEKLRSRLQARITILDGKLIDIRNMAEKLNELARRKSYDERG
jgi:hypothetical protein